MATLPQNQTGKVQLSPLKNEDFDTSKTKLQSKLPQDDTEPIRSFEEPGNKPKTLGKHQAMSASPSKSYNIRSPSKSNMKATWSNDLEDGKYMKKYKNTLEAETHGKSFKDLEVQNGLLRSALKDLNEQLKEEIEKSRVVEFSGKKVEFSQKSSEEKSRTIIRELANNEKILSINEEEYRKTEARLEMIKSPSYLLDIQENISETNKQMEELRRENRKLELANGVIGKDLDKIENITGLPSNIEEAQEKERECETLKRKLALLKQKNAASLEEKSQKLEKGRKMNHEIKNMQIEVFGEEGPEDEKIVAKRNALKRKIKAMEDDLKFTENKYKKFIHTTLTKDLEELLAQNRKDVEHILTLEEIISEQTSALKDLVEVEGFKQNKGTQQVVERIKESLDDTDKFRAWSLHSETSGNAGEQHYRSQTIKKARDLGMGLKLRQDASPGASYSPVKKYNSSTSKNKFAVKRELGGQRMKSVWKETDNVGEERMDLHLAKSQIGPNEAEDTKLYSKPIGIKRNLKGREDLQIGKGGEHTFEKLKKEDGPKSVRVSRKNSQEEDKSLAKENGKKVPKLEKLLEEKLSKRNENSSPAQKSKREDNKSPALESERKDPSPKRTHKEKTKKEEEFEGEEDQITVIKKNKESSKPLHKEKVKREEEEEKKDEEKKATFFGNEKKKESAKSKLEETIEDDSLKVKQEKHQERNKPQEDDEIDYTRHRRGSDPDIIKKGNKKNKEERLKDDEEETNAKEIEKSKLVGDIKERKEIKAERRSSSKELAEELNHEQKEIKSEKKEDKNERSFKKDQPSKNDNNPKGKESYEEENSTHKDEKEKIFGLTASKNETSKPKVETEKEKESVKEIKNKEENKHKDEHKEMENNKQIIGLGQQAAMMAINLGNKPVKLEEKKQKEKENDLFDDPFEDENLVKKTNKPTVVEKKKVEPPKKEAEDFEEFDFDNDL